MVAPPEPDAESARWVTALTGTAAQRRDAQVELHAVLLRIARSELHRRSGQLAVTGPEFDDLAHQSAADALLAITAKVGEFRGESRFTTWAYKFVMFEVSAKVGRHYWRHPPVALDTEDWDRLPDRLGLDPARQSEWSDLAAALRDAVDRELTDRQRMVFVAIVVDAVPLDALAVRIGTSRGALYKTMFDARRKLRASLVANGYLADSTGPTGAPPPVEGRQT